MNKINFYYFGANNRGTPILQKARDMHAFVQGERERGRFINYITSAPNISFLNKLGGYNMQVPSFAIGIDNGTSITILKTYRSTRLTAQQFAVDWSAAVNKLTAGGSGDTMPNPSDVLPPVQAGFGMGAKIVGGLVLLALVFNR